MNDDEINVHIAVEEANAYALKHDCTRFVNARVRYRNGALVIGFYHGDWFCSDASVYRADTNGKGEWL